MDLLGTPEVKLYNLQPKTSWIWERIVEIEARLARNNLLSPSKVHAMMELKETGYFIPNPPYWSNMAMSGGAGVDDDHRPFMERGVPIVHVIPSQFPRVWHKKSDNADAIKPEVSQDFARIFRILENVTWLFGKFYIFIKIKLLSLPPSAQGCQPLCAHLNFLC